MTTDTSEAPEALRTRSFAMTLLFGVAALTIALAGARSIQDIIGPVFLALVLTVTLHPIRIWLEGHGVKQVLASIIMLVTTYALLILLTLALMVSVAQLAALVPQYSDQIQEVRCQRRGLSEEPRRQAGADRRRGRRRSTRASSSTSPCPCCPARSAS